MTIRSQTFLAAIGCVLLLGGADWRQFRGNHADGVSSESDVPTSFANLAWTAELPGRGASGAIIVGEHVFVTASSGYDQDRLHVLCFDAATGEERWERQFWATGRTQTHPKTCVASPTPASDGRRVFAFFSSNDLACLDLEGDLLWYRGLGHDFPNASNSLGMASSPIIVGETLIVQVESDAEAFAVGLDPATGIRRWKIDRPQRANWTSPTVLAGDDDGEEPLALLQSSAGITAIEPRTGAEAWTYVDGAATIPSSVVSQQTVYVPSHGLTALRPLEGSAGPEMLWRSNRLGPGTASPLLVDGLIYVINNAGVLIAAHPNDGEIAWRLRLEGSHSASPIAAAGHLFAVNEEGIARIVRLDPSGGEVIAEHELDETVLSTPAIANRAVYVRSDGHLWKFAR